MACQRPLHWTTRSTSGLHRLSWAIPILAPRSVTTTSPEAWRRSEVIRTIFAACGALAAMTSVRTGFLIEENEMRAVIYARYSSDQQREASIEDQIRVCERRIEREGWTFLHSYVDRAVSGASRLR